MSDIEKNEYIRLLKTIDERNKAVYNNNTATNRTALRRAIKEHLAFDDKLSVTDRINSAISDRLTAIRAQIVDQLRSKIDGSLIKLWKISATYAKPVPPIDVYVYGRSKRESKLKFKNLPAYSGFIITGCELCDAETTDYVISNFEKFSLW